MGSIYGAAKAMGGKAEKRAQAADMSKTKRRVKVKRRGKKAC